MQLRYEEDFVESAIGLCASGRRKGIPPPQIARFHRERERLYGILDADERNSAFFKLHLGWFREWELERPIISVLAEHRLLRERLTVMAIRGARGKHDEGAELYVNQAGEKNAVVALRLERL